MVPVQKGFIIRFLGVTHWCGRSILLLTVKWSWSRQLHIEHISVMWFPTWCWFLPPLPGSQDKSEEKLILRHIFVYVIKQLFKLDHLQSSQGNVPLVGQIIDIWSHTCSQSNMFGHHWLSLNTMLYLIDLHYYLFFFQTEKRQVTLAIK